MASRTLSRLFMSISKLLSFTGGDSEKPRILILAPTGVAAINIDGISMVSSMLFYQAHQRLSQIFGVSTDLPFAGLPVLVCGNLYQLPPVKGVSIYSTADNIKGYSSLELWNNFKVVELTEVMRQSGDLDFISFLNKIQVGIVDYEGEKILSRFIAKDNPAYPKHALHMQKINHQLIIMN